MLLCTVSYEDISKYKKSSHAFNTSYNPYCLSLQFPQHSSILKLKFWTLWWVLKLPWTALPQGTPYPRTAGSPPIPFRRRWRTKRWSPPPLCLLGPTPVPPPINWRRRANSLLSRPRPKVVGNYEVHIRTVCSIHCVLIISFFYFYLGVWNQRSWDGIRWPHWTHNVQLQLWSQKLQCIHVSADIYEDLTIRHRSHFLRKDLNILCLITLSAFSEIDLWFRT